MRSIQKSSALLLVIAYIGFVSLGLPDAVIGVAWPSIREHFHLRQGNLALVFIAAGIGYFISSSFIGRILLRTPIGVLLAASSLLVAVSGFGFALAPIWILFAGCAIVHGLGSGAIDAGLNHYAAHHFSPRHMNWLHACYSLGATLGPLLMTAVLVQSGSWRTGYATVGAAMLSLSLLFFTTRKYWDSAPPPPETDRDPHATTTLRNSTVYLQVLIFFIYTGLEVSVGQWGFTLLTESRGISRENAGLWITLYWASIGVGRILFGFVVEAIGIDRLLRYSTSAAAIGALLLAGRFPSPLLGLILVGLGLAPVYPCMMTRTPQRLGKALAAHAIGFQVGAAMLGAAFLPSVCGLLADISGLEQIPKATAILAITLCLMHEFLLRRPGLSASPEKQPS